MQRVKIALDGLYRDLGKKLLRFLHISQAAILDSEFKLDLKRELHIVVQVFSHLGSKIL